VIGRLEKTVIDCPDTHALSRFYCDVLGMRVNEELHGWVVVDPAGHPFCIVFGQANG
jgi:extradiol dioxygenase family protein